VETRMAAFSYTCPFCGKEFQLWYWYIPNLPGHYKTITHRGLALANFNRHKRACGKKNGGGGRPNTP
jgi:hypothetical protein